MSNHERGHWGSSLGFLLAAVGSAVGLGNLWGFPYKMGMNGGFAFLVVYLILAVFIGFIMIMTEMSIGRRAHRGVVGAYAAISKKYTWMGWIGIIVPTIILFFYTVLGAYCLEYFCLNLADLGFRVVNVSGGDLFGGMLTNPIGSIAFTAAMLVLAFLIVKSGIRDGIERFNMVGMPLLAVMLVIVIIRSVTLPGAAEGLAFMFAPNIEPFKENFVGVLAVAAGQMFFSLSLAMGITVTYGSYLSKAEKIVKNSMLVVIFDTLVAIMAGMAILPASIALGGKDAALAGPKLLFVTLQDVFNSMGAIGPLFGTIFYLLVVIATITSIIALIEVDVTMYSDKCHDKGKDPNRFRATAIVCIIIFIGGALVAADGLGSNGIWVPTQKALGIHNYNDCWLDLIDFVAEGLLMPFLAFLTSIVVGWLWGPKNIKDEIEMEGHKFGMYKFYWFCIKFVVPIAMIFVLLGQLDSFLSLGIFS